MCEHRWQAIAGMASFRKAVNGEQKSEITTVGNGVSQEGTFPVNGNAWHLTLIVFPFSSVRCVLHKIFVHFTRPTSGEGTKDSLP